MSSGSKGTAGTALVTTKTRGRPRTPDEPRIKAELCELVSTGMTRRDACQILGVPSSTVGQWIYEDAEFSACYARARVEQAHNLADEALSISAEPVASMEAVQRNRLRVDTIKWLASKLAPRMYGERIMAEHTHRVGVVMLPSLPTGAVDP